MKIHKLKLNLKFCDEVFYGEKSFEIRQNDRGFQTGDKIIFIPVDENGMEHTHLPLSKKIYKITYILSGWDLKNGYVALAIKECE